MPKIFYWIILSLIVILLIFVFTNPKEDTPDSTETPPTEITTEEDTSKADYPTIVLDAGHGGFDPGKVGINDILEKDINLSIVQKLTDILTEEGFTVVLTRDKDELLCSPTSKSKKKDDMIARIEKITEINPMFTVSIHQNSFTAPEVNGPQVFYYETSPESAALACIIQDVLNQELEPEKSREPQANDNYYLLTRTPTPTVIVECGFLSNPKEAELLSSDEYQQKVAHAIYLGIMSYYETKTTQTPSE